MKESWLVQRLNLPLGGGRLENVIEAFSFGGGRRNGGLSDEAMSMLRPLFSFDYMGAAEFEFGAVPKALERLAKADALSAATGTVDLNGNTHTVYAIAAGPDLDEVFDRAQSWVLPFADRARLKEPTQMDRTLSGDEFARAVGWLELDNGFFVFTDRAMYEGVAAVFGVEADAQVSS